MNKKDNRITTGGIIPQQGQTQPNTVIMRAPKRFNLDISDFTSAVQNAENIDYSRRYKLFDLYDDVFTDAHLTSVIEKRKNNVKALPIQFVRADGSVDDSVCELIDSPWFDRLIDDVLDTKFYGFSLLQFYRDDKWINYDLVPRKNVDPVRKLILHNQTDLQGWAWDEFTNLLFIGSPRDLGVLYKAAPWVIYKRNDIADWAQFAEIFGMPTREYTYDTDDDDARARAVRDANESGALASFIHSKDTEFNLVDSGSKTASADLYERLAEICNKELSKLVLGNTLTTDAGDKGTQALGTVHKKEENTYTKSDRRFLLNVLNYDMSDIWKSMGVNVADGKFKIPEPKDIDLTAKAAIVTQLSNQLGLPVSDDYLYNTFNIAKPDNYDALKTQLQQRRMAEQAAQSVVISDDGNDEDNEHKPSKPTDKADKSFFARLHNFFVHAPKKGAPLDW